MHVHIYDTLLFYKKCALCWLRVNLTEDKKSSFDALLQTDRKFLIVLIRNSDSIFTVKCFGMRMYGLKVVCKFMIIVAFNIITVMQCCYVL